MLFNKLLKYIKSDFIKVFSFTALSTFIKLITGFITVKVVAVIIGPSGIALLGQLRNFITISNTIATGGINIGVTKYIAEKKEYPKIVKYYIGTSIKITLLLSSIVGLIIIFLNKYLAYQILKNSAFSYIFIILGCTIILYALNSLFLSILNGFKEFKKFITVNIITSITGLVFSVSLVYLWELKGALISAVTYQSVIVFATFILLLKSSWFSKEFLLGKLKLSCLRNLSKYSLMAFVSILTVPLSQLIVRTYVISQLSIDEAGLWESVVRISNMYLMVITSSLSVYYLPTISEISNNKVYPEIIKSLKTILPIVISLGAGVFLFRGLIIKILFSSEFIEMKKLFLFQILGDIFKITGWLFSYALVAKTVTKYFIYTEIIFSFLYTILAIVLVNFIGIQGMVVAYFINYILFSFTLFIIIRKIFYIAI